MVGLSTVVFNTIERKDPSGLFVVAAIPAFNEEKNIASVIVQAQRYVDQVIVCDDGSTDLTAEIARAMGAFVIKHDGNRGYGASLLSLFKEASKINADLVITLDADDQHDPSEIPLFIERVGRGDVDIVIGSRFLKEGADDTPSLRRWGIKVLNTLTSNGHVRITDSQSGFRAYTRRALDSLNLTENGMGISTEILVKAGERGLRVSEVPIHITYEVKAKRNPFKHGFEVLINTFKHLSLHRPLVFYGGPGVAMILLSMFFWGVTIQEFARTQAILTNAALLGIGTMLVGLLLLTTAIILWVVTTLLSEQARR